MLRIKRGGDMKEHHVKIERLDAITEVFIDGEEIKHVKDYKVTSSADGTTELVLKLVFKSDITKFEMSANQKEQTS